MGGKPGAIKIGVVLAFRNVISIPQNQQSKQDKKKQTNKGRQEGCPTSLGNQQVWQQPVIISAGQTETLYRVKVPCKKLSDKAKPSGSFQYGKGMICK